MQPHVLSSHPTVLAGTQSVCRGSRAPSVSEEAELHHKRRLVSGAVHVSALGEVSVVLSCDFGLSVVGSACQN